MLFYQCSFSTTTPPYLSSPLKSAIFSLRVLFVCEGVTSAGASSPPMRRTVLSSTRATQSSRRSARQERPASTTPGRSQIQTQVGFLIKSARQERPASTTPGRSQIQIQVGFWSARQERPASTTRGRSQIQIQVGFLIMSARQERPASTTPGRSQIQIQVESLTRESSGSMRACHSWQKSDADTGRKICKTEKACLYYFWQKSDSNRIFNARVLKQQKLEEHMKTSAHL